MTSRSTPSKPHPSAARRARPIAAADDPWSPVAGLPGLAEELTLHVDGATGAVTRLTRIAPGADTAGLGADGRADSETVIVVSGRLFDAARGRWLEVGQVVDPPLGDARAALRTDDGCVVLEVSRAQGAGNAPAPRRGGEAWPGPGI